MAELPSPPVGGVDALAPGRLLAGRYRLDERLASGGMAEVWQASDEVLRRSVAVKVLHAHLAADPVVRERFRREAVAAARLSHPAIISIFDTVVEPTPHGPPIEAIVMELVRGSTLRQALDQRGALPPDEAVELGVQVADALGTAHRAGVVHRDVKPANILLCPDGRVLVADFGIATAVDALDLTETGVVLGTAKYLSPEQVRGEAVDPRTDVYALGVVLYECLTGRPPFDAPSSAAIALARLEHDPVPLRRIKAGVPRSVEDVVLRALARDPAARFASADELRQALLAAEVPVDGTTRVEAVVPPLPTGPTGPPPTFRQSERSWLLPGALILLVATALAVAGVLLGRTDAGQRLIRAAQEAVGVEPTPTTPTTTPGPAPALARIVDFDPFGGDGEHADELPLLTDGDPATTWRTEGYRRSDLGGAKPGVGLVVELTAPASGGRLVIETADTGFDLSVHVAAAPAADLAGWGQPVARLEDVVADGGRLEVELPDDRPFGAVLLWITDLGPEGPPHVVALSAVSVAA